MFRRQADGGFEISPTDICYCYSNWTISLFLAAALFTEGAIFNFKTGCYLEIFAHSISVSNANANANISTADWKIGLIAKSPVSGCKIALHTIKSRLYRGDEIISESSVLMDSFGQLVGFDERDGSMISVGFQNVATYGVNVVRDYRVEILARVKATDVGDCFLTVLCGDLPVKFTAGPEGNVMGTLLGNMKRCDYFVQDEIKVSL